MEVKTTYVGTMLSLATVAFGLIAATAWNTAIKDLIAIVLKPGAGVVAEIVYAILVSILAIVVVRSIGKVVERVEARKAERFEARK